MSDDKQVEAWKKEFESLCEFNLTPAEPEYGDKGVYAQPWGNDTLKGFLMAKRSMKPIELPRTNWNPVLMGHFYSHGEVVKAITAAGYSYRVKE